MIGFTAAVVIIYVMCLIGLIWAYANYLQVKSINLLESTGGEYVTLGEDGGRNKVETMLAIGDSIARVNLPFITSFLISFRVPMLSFSKNIKSWPFSALFLVSQSK